MWVGICTPFTFTNVDANCKGITGIITQFSSNYAKNQNILIADIYISISTETFDIENIKYEEKKNVGNS